jgi:formylglycine-generating enzyme required for sulfatase activity
MKFPISFYSALTGILLLLSGLNGQAQESQEFVDKIVTEHRLSPSQRSAIERILFSSRATRNIGTEDPNEIFGPNQSVHPASRATCVQRVLQSGRIRPNPDAERVCGARWMVPIGSDQRVCIDQFEFPNIPCEYPLVWVSSFEASRLCQSMGKRLCNSHEWEGACAGRAHPPQESYRFELGSLQERRARANQGREMIWAFSWNPEVSPLSSRAVCGIFRQDDPDFDPRIAGRISLLFDGIGKSRTCHTMGSDYRSCGTNSWLAGMKYQCRTQAGVFDLHGNVAEVTNFPRSPQGLAFGANTDFTERKGSFFVHRPSYPDDCRVRQPYEHFHQIISDRHSYYQEGFRCCKDIRD